jgi:putative two-component system response regulator
MTDVTAFNLRPFSTAHSRRVGRTSARVAAQMGLSATYIELLGEAAPLHDIGKLAFPRAIWEKPGPLTPREWAFVRMHTVVGARILGDSEDPVLRMAATIAAAHHERWDGSGYPEGLAGEEIPLCARIVAVADTFDALTHARPYKGPWPLHVAVEEIRAGAGSQFDPAVVAAFAGSPGKAPPESALQSLSPGRS